VKLLQDPPEIMEVLPYYFGKVKIILPDEGPIESLTTTVSDWEVLPATSELDEIVTLVEGIVIVKAVSMKKL